MSPDQNFGPEANSLSPATLHGSVWDNPIVTELPNHLKQFIVEQRYESYTPIDHAVWRYVMRQNYDYLKVHAHEAYTTGLTQTGIDIEAIPSIATMNEILGQIGWAAVTVDGFIPPAAFMEFQAFRVLVIAADIRSIDHIEYTPAPDIIHEAAGHAPIIADQQYADYLSRFGEIGSKAMSSKKDYELYEAIRHLSILKEMPSVDPVEMKKAEQKVTDRQDNLGEPSEMALLSRLHWWTVEYGLIGTLDKPRIYGAGLLSSIGESANCLTDHVKKIPYDLHTSEFAFDIVNQQPQLFVTPDFPHLTDILEEFASSMAFRQGGLSGLRKALECQNLCTVVLSSGLQLSGKVISFEKGTDKQPSIVVTDGPTMLAYENRELIPGSKSLYDEGIYLPIGNLRDCDIAIEEMTDSDLSDFRIIAGHTCRLEFDNEVSVEGLLSQIVRRNGKIILFEMSECKISSSSKLLHDSKSKIYHLAIGERIVSVFGSAADKDAFEPVSLVPHERTMRPTPGNQEQNLGQLYQSVREIRKESKDINQLEDIWSKHAAEHNNDWLLPLEILELLSNDTGFEKTTAEIIVFLTDRKQNDPKLSDLIDNGLALIEKTDKK